MFQSLPVRGGATSNGKPSYSSADAAEQLTRHSYGWAGPAGGQTTVTYAFRSSGSAGENTDFILFDPQQMVATELALKAWSDVANIRFARVGTGTSGDGAYSNDATMLFGNYVPAEDDGGAAFASYPGSRAPSADSGDVWLRADMSDNVYPRVGFYGQLTLTHEIGHAIGLSHPSNYDASDDAEASYATSAAYFEDSRQYSIMSYFASSNTGANPPVFSAAPQIDDIAAAQLLYGANYAARAGDTTYGFNSTSGQPYDLLRTGSDQLYYAVWDGGGNDRLDFSGYTQDQTIDLRQGAFSSVGGSVGNVSIAVGATIEEAVGGTGNDTLIANDASDVIIGGAGGDSILGGAGNDHLYGGGRTAIEGDGYDTILAGDGSDYVQGNAGNDRLFGGNGSDRIFGGQGDDVIRGEAGNDSINGNLGNDVISGAEGQDSLRGGQGDDHVHGGDGSDTLFGDLGNDWLEGTYGFDQLTGGAGSDRFSFGYSGFTTTGSSDVILDFEDGVDRLSGEVGTGQVLQRAMDQASGAEVMAYAQQVLNGTVGTMLAIGWQGSTVVFTAQADFGIAAVRLAGFGDQGRITIDDFI